MADVRIPTLNRVNPVEPDTAGRVNANVPDFERAAAPQAKAADALGQGLEDFFQQQEKSKAITVSTDLSNQHDRFQYDALQKAKANKGDPDAAFMEYDRQVKENYDSLISKHPDVPEFTRTMIESGLKESQRRFYDNRTTAYGHNVEQYKDDVVASGVQISKTSMMGAGGSVIVGDSTSLSGIQNELSRIGKLYLDRGLANGYVTIDKDGNYIPNDIVKQQIAKARSEGLYHTIENLNATGAGDKANYVLEQFGGYLDDVNGIKARSGVKQSVIKQEALGHVARASQMGSDEGLKYIDGLKKKDSSPHGLQVWDQALKDWNSHQGIMQSEAKRQAKDHYEGAQKRFEVLKDSFNGDKNLMMSDPVIANHWKYMDHKQQQAMLDAVEQPKRSDNDQLFKVQNLIKSGDFFKLSPPDLSQALMGLSKEDRGRYQRSWDRVATRTDTEMSALMSTGSKTLEKELISTGVIKPAMFEKTGYNKLNLGKLLEAQRNFEDHLQTLPAGATKKDVDQWAHDYAVDLQKKNTFPDTPAPKVSGEIAKPPVDPNAKIPAGPTAANVNEQPMTSGRGVILKRSDWSLKFRAQFKRFADPNKKELEAWVKEQ